MTRRRLLLTLAASPLALYLWGRPRRARAVVTSRHGGRATPLDAGAPATPPNLQSYAYYEGLGESEPLSPSRTDGTTYNMPCITTAEISAATDKDYTFWHGHGGVDHHFTLTTADFQALQRGEDVTAYTTIVEDHRHALLVSPLSPCESEACRDVGARVRWA